MNAFSRLFATVTLGVLALPVVVFADVPVRSCCAVLNSQTSTVSKCYQFIDVLPGNPSEAEQVTMRDYQQYSCSNVPQQFADHQGKTSRLIRNDVDNSGVCGTALSIACPTRQGNYVVGSQQVHARCQTASDCFSATNYLCQNNFCKLKEGQPCAGDNGLPINCAEGLLCRTTFEGSKCLTPEANVERAEDVSTGLVSGDGGAPFIPVIPRLGVQIPGFSFTSATEEEGIVSIPYLSQYINAIYRYMTAIVLTVAIVMIIIGGFKYLLAASPLAVKDGKKTITDAVIGMMLVLGAYVILNSINPALLSLAPLNLYRVEPEGFEYISIEDMSALAGQSSYSGGGAISSNTSETVRQAILVGRRVAQERGIDECYMVATIQSESGGRFAAVGHDENVRRVSTRARGEFLRRGHTYLGQPVSQNTLNDDRLDPTKPDHGLDMEMSHGLGIGQVTIGKTMCRGASTCDLYQCEKGGQLIYGAKLSDGVCYSVPDLLTLEGGLRAMSNFLVSKLRAANGNVARARALYVGYANSPSWETDSRTVNFMRKYNACRSGGGS